MMKAILKKMFGANAQAYSNRENINLNDLVKGKVKAILFGSAPSINKIDIVKFDDTYFKVSMGNFHEHKDIAELNPNIHVFARSHPPITFEVLKQWFERAHHRLPRETAILLSEKDFKNHSKIFKNRRVFTYQYGGKRPIDFTQAILSPWSVAQIALQLAIYMRIATIEFIGIDHDWQNITEYKHFYSHNEPSLELFLSQIGVEVAYPKSGARLGKEKLYQNNKLFSIYEVIKEEASKLGINIYNSDPYSLFDVYPKINDE